MEGTETRVQALWGQRGPQPEFLQLAGWGLRAGGWIFLGPHLVTSRMGVAASGLFYVGRTHL